MTDEYLLMDAWVPIERTAAIAGVHRDTIYAWIKEDSIPVHKAEGSGELKTRARKTIRLGDLLEAARKRGRTFPATPKETDDA